MYNHPSVWHKFISLIYLFKKKKLVKVYLKLKKKIKKSVLYKQICFFFFLRNILTNKLTLNEKAHDKPKKKVWQMDGKLKSQQ